MDNYYYTIIISNENPNITSLEYYYIKSDFTLIDDSHISIDNKLYEFTYLMYTKDINVIYQSKDILLENNIPVVNMFHQTTVENIFCLDRSNIEEQINIILEEI